MTPEVTTDPIKPVHQSEGTPACVSVNMVLFSHLSDIPHEAGQPGRLYARAEFIKFLLAKFGKDLNTLINPEAEWALFAADYTARTGKTILSNEHHD